MHEANLKNVNITRQNSPHDLLMGYELKCKTLISTAAPETLTEWYTTSHQITTVHNNVH
jgi:hypothetical protein